MANKDSLIHRFLGIHVVILWLAAIVITDIKILLFSLIIFLKDFICNNSIDDKQNIVIIL